MCPLEAITHLADVGAAQEAATRVMLSDEALMLQFHAGSQQSLEELFARYRDPLYGFFRRRLRDKERANDLSQETWIAVMKGVERYQPRALFRTYLYGIALKILAGDRRKSAKHEPVIGTAEIPVLDASDSHHHIREALDKLDATDREVIMLREYEQLSYAEIAALLHIPVNTVRSRLFRARLALKSLLEPGSEQRPASRR
ncbi:MAG: RNA polymerase sigma factor [Acidobacteriaceae bacterium]|nr:RNA polymerase sigma factor [Acidobacteriaceae bacterium]